MTKSISDLGPSEFEELVFDLVQALGLKSAVWRTPGRDGGRDIQGEWYVDDLSGHVGRQVWYVECKKYEASVSWPVVWEKIAFAESNEADVLLFAVTSSLSPQAVDEVNRWNANRKRPLIRFWNGFDVEKQLRLFPVIAIRFGLIANPSIEIGGALLPAINILLKFSISAHSAEVFEIPAGRKRIVLYSLSELISARLSEFESDGAFSIANFREAIDGFDWLENSVVLERLHVDRYSIRVLTCYLMDFLRLPSMRVHEQGDNVFFELNTVLPAPVFHDLRQISLLSNFEIHQENKRLLLKVR